MFDADKIISMLQTELPKGLNAVKAEGSAMIDKVKTDGESKNTAMGAAAAGALGALLLSGVMGKFGRKVATMGGIAALGTLAYQAYQKHAGSETSEQKFLPEVTQKEALGKVIIKAIINAMKADGKIDETEKSKLFDKMQNAGLSDEEKAFLFEELNKAIDTDGLVASANSPEIATQAYAASFVAINPDGDAERAYLDDLAKRLNITPDLAMNIRNEALAV